MSSKFNLRKQTLFDRASSLFAWSCAAVVTVLAVWLLAETLRQGIGELSLSFLVDEPTDAGRGGGIGPMIVSTFLIVLVCISVSVPLGLGTAVMLSEYTRRRSGFGWWVRRSLDVLAGVPSIVFGLFGNAFFCQYLQMGYSVLSGGLTLACMVLPILIRMTESGIRAVPQEYRYAAASLGLSQTTTLIRIVLPASMPALAAGLVLGMGRALAETAALIFTSGYVTRTPESLFDSGRALSVHVYDMAMNVPGGNSRSFATATVLVLMLLVINGLVIAITRYTGRHSTGDTFSDVLLRRDSV